MVEQRSTVSPWTTTARSRFMSFHQARTSAWNDPSISRTMTRPSASDPHAVEVAAAALACRGARPVGRRRQPGLGADLPDVDLGERLGATGDVAEDEPEGLAVPQLADQRDGRPEAVGRGEALLHAGGQQPDGATYVAVALRRQERGVLEGQPRRSADRLDPRARTAGASGGRSSPSSGATRSPFGVSTSMTSRPTQCRPARRAAVRWERTAPGPACRTPIQSTLQLGQRAGVA